MTKHIEIDFETRSDVDLMACGAYVYFESPHARVLIGSYRIDGAPVRRWAYGEPCPPELREAIEEGATISAHNASFEALCFMWLHRNQNWPMPRFEQFRCTAATAAAMALPRSLEGLGAALGLEAQKDKGGKRLINKFSKPRKPKEREDPDSVYWNEPEEHPEDFEKLKQYCDQDLLTEAAADKRLVPLSDVEQQLWQLSERINRRGIRIDVKSALSATRIADEVKERLNKQIEVLTEGYVTACGQNKRVVEWVRRQGVDISSVKSDEVDELLEFNDLPDRVRSVLEVRQEAAKASIAKLTAMLNRANKDGRVRGSSIYHGASTGRFVNVGVNFNNLPRPRRVFDDSELRLSALFRAFRNEDADLLPYLYGEDLGRPLRLISDAIRGFIWAAPGHDLIQADYTGIEGAVIAWLSGEHWKLKALHDIIADPSLPDMYRRTAARITNTTTDVITKKHPLRQSLGKVSELALGFGGGVSAFYGMARNYGVKLDTLYEPVWNTADARKRERATKRYQACLKRKNTHTDKLSPNAWIACELVKLGWRDDNPAIRQSWYDLENAAREAVQNPGTVTSAAKVKYTFRKGFLWALLPSGRCLAYGSPRLKDQVWGKVKLPNGSWSEAEVMDLDTAQRRELRGLVKIEGNTRPKVTVLGVDGITKKWRRYALYGGLLAENNTQAVARDILVNGMWQAEERGYRIITTVYDEILAEVPKGYGDLSELESVMCDLPAWAEGLPLTASGWRGKRYRKD